MLKRVNKAGENGYACIFDHVPSTWKDEGCVSFHALDTDKVLLHGLPIIRKQINTYTLENLWRLSLDFQRLLRSIDF